MLGSFSNDDGNNNEDVKKVIGLFRKTTTLHVHHAFLYISLPSLHKYNMKMPNCKFFPSLKLRALLKKSTPGKFAYICHFKQIGINATVFEKWEFILKVMFSLTLPSSMLKLPTIYFLNTAISFPILQH